MKICFAVFLCILCGCAKSPRSEFGEPFTFIGVPERIDEKVHRTIEGSQRRYVIRVIEVQKGKFDAKEIGFDFSEDAKPPLEIGKRYLFSAGYDRHGIYYQEVVKLATEPNQSSEPTSMSVTICAAAQIAPAMFVAHL